MTNRAILLSTISVTLLLEACALSASATGGGTGGVGASYDTGGTGGGTEGTGGSGTGTSSTSGAGGSTIAPKTPCTNQQAIRSKIEGASKGDIIKLDACTLEGPLDVPAGVTIVGLGQGQSWIEAKAGTFGLHVLPGEGKTHLSGLSLTSSGNAAIVAKGAVDLAIDDVEVVLQRGLGVAIDGATSLSLKNVSVNGGVTPRSAREFPADVQPKEAPTHGIVVLNTATVVLDATTVTGLADYGALFLDSNLTWTGGSASQTLGTGLFVHGGSAKLESVSLCSAFPGNRKVPAYNGVFEGGAQVSSKGLQVCDGFGMGLLHVGANGVHNDITATGNHGPAIWVQAADSFELGGATNLVEGNRFAGMVFVDVAKVHVSNTKVSNTALATRTLGPAGKGIELGDGVQLVRSGTDTVFNSVSFTGNAHTGLQVDLGPYDPMSPLVHLTWTSVTAESTGAAFGAICQGSPDGTEEIWGPGTYNWDKGITRSGAAAINDGLLIDPNDLVGLIDPNDRPSPTSLLKGEGLASLGVKGL
ncbi:MAG: hypothetical protein U0359_15310 [Byssovorax sp.]